MATSEMGQIEPVDVRTVWEDEARDFTPWLAENLALLGDELGMELRLVQREAQVGPYYLDILARDVKSGVNVAIENQLDEADFGHLGALLVYATGSDARVVVWVAPRFYDEHRAVIDWLNRWTSDEIEFYGVEIRAVKIGDSQPAPQFRAVASPQGWSKRMKSASRGRSPENQKYFDFFEPLVFKLRQRCFTCISRVPARYYQTFPSEWEGITYGVAFDRRGAWAYLTIDMLSNDKESNVRLMDDLRKRLEKRGTGGDFNWHWDPFPTTPSCAVGVVTEASIYDSQEKLEQTRKWMAATLHEIKSVLEPRLEEILKELPSDS